MTHLYAQSDYVASYRDMDSVFFSSHWDCALEIRSVGGSRLDLAGPYPLTPIPSGERLAKGLAAMEGQGFVSLLVVPDPLVSPSYDQLAKHFDFAKLYKPHFVQDPAAGPFYPTRHHRANIRRALRHVDVGEFSLSDHLDEWTNLYEHLSRRHSIPKNRKLPEAHHRFLASRQEVRGFGAFLSGELVSATLWVVEEGRAYHHLSASSLAGYETGASYGVMASSLEELRYVVCDLGGGAGDHERDRVGLESYKRGFCNSTRNAYVCGKILESAAYEELSSGLDRNNYFPAYRTRLT